MRRFATTLLALSLCAVASARSTPPPLPEPVSVARPDLALVGQGTLNWFVFRVYDAWLWAPEGRWDPDAPFVLDLQYARELKGAAIADRSVEEMRQLGAADDGQLVAWSQFMRAAFPDVREGDRITGEFVPGGATRFYLNGAHLAEIDDPEFGPAFSGIWLAPGTSAPGLRRQLLGADDNAG